MCVGVWVYVRAYKFTCVSLCVCLCCVCVCVYTQTLCHVLILEHARQAYFIIVSAEEPRHLLKGL